MSTRKQNNGAKFKFPANISVWIVEALGDEARRENRDRNAHLEYILQERFAAQNPSQAAQASHPVTSGKRSRARKAARRATATP